MSLPVLPRETVEFLPVEVTVDGTVVSTGVDLCILPSRGDHKRPLEDDWLEAVTLSGRIGLMIDGLAPGTYVVFARVTSFPEVPVVEVGSVVID